MTIIAISIAFLALAIATASIIHDRITEYRRQHSFPFFIIDGEFIEDLAKELY